MPKNPSKQSRGLRAIVDRIRTITAPAEGVVYDLTYSEACVDLEAYIQKRIKAAK